MIGVWTESPLKRRITQLVAMAVSMVIVTLPFGQSQSDFVAGAARLKTAPMKIRSNGYEPTPLPSVICQWTRVRERRPRRAGADAKDNA